MLQALIATSAHSAESTAGSAEWAALTVGTRPLAGTQRVLYSCPARRTSAVKWARQPSGRWVSRASRCRRARTVYEKEGRHAAPIGALTGHWGFKSPTTGPASVTYAALLKFVDDRSHEVPSSLSTDEVRQVRAPVGAGKVHQGRRVPDPVLGTNQRTRVVADRGPCHQRSSSGRRGS